MAKSPQISRSQDSFLSRNTGRILIVAVVVVGGFAISTNPAYWSMAPAISKLITNGILGYGIIALLLSYVSESFKTYFHGVVAVFLGFLLIGFCVHLNLLSFDGFLTSAFMYFALITPWYFLRQSDLIIYQLILILGLVFTVLVTPEAQPESFYYLYRFIGANVLVFLLANSKILSVRRLMEENRDANDLKININEGLVQTDRDFNISFVSDTLAKMLGRDPQKFIGRYILTEVIPPEERAEQAKRLAQPTPDHRARYFMHLLREDGFKIPVQVSVAPRINASGGLGGFNILFIQVQDYIDQIQQLEDEFSQLQRKVRDNDAKRVELERFAGSVASDLRGPLETINRGIQILYSLKDSFDPMAAEYMEEMEKSIGNVFDIMQSVLLYSISDTQQMKISELNLNKLLSEVKASLEPLILANKVKLVYEDLPEIKADKIQLLRLFRSFIENAISRRAEVDPVIHFSYTTNPEKREYIFSVQDNGHGINREDYENIFRIFQDEESPQLTQDSFGFGLSICHRIVQNHKGRLWFTSNIGKGTTFHFSLPMIQEEETEDLLSLH